MLNSEIGQVLATSLLFRRISLESIEYLLEACERRALAPGETLIDPGRPNDYLYVLLKGQLRVYLGGRDLPAHAILETGDCVGEMSLIDGQVPSALVIAAGDSEVLAIPHDTLWAMVDQSHGLARNLLAIIAGRLRRDNLTLLTTQSKSLEFEQAASVDALTGLHNRRWLMEAFPRAIERCERDGSPLCLVMADIDHFKNFNDRHGHLVGDAVLRRVAGQLAAGLRAQDLIARYGGEEFALLLPRTDTLEGLEIAQRLRAMVADIRFTHGGHTTEEHITLSCGVAPLRLGQNLDALIASADKALYRAKEGGRDRVELSAED